MPSSPVNIYRATLLPYAIPRELAGGQYVRNGGNPTTNEDLGRDAHWFDGDGMLSGVLFRRSGEKNMDITPEFVNQYVLTDVYLNAKGNRNLKRPILPSIATLVSGSLITILLVVMRTVFLAILSALPGSRQRIKKISVANTGVVYHDGRALATCESGPPMRFQLPSLETVGWYNGRKAESEPGRDKRSGFGGDSSMAFMKEWTTGHPRVDPVTKEMITFHAVFIKPYVFCSIVPPAKAHKKGGRMLGPRFDMPIPGMGSPKMMHDFGVAAEHTVIMDLPLSLDPMNNLTGKPVVSYDPTDRSRFGVFPRYAPQKIQWFETNADERAPPRLPPDIGLGRVQRGCARATQPKARPARVRRGGAVPTVLLQLPPLGNQLRFIIIITRAKPTIRNQWALSAIPFEFPTISPAHEMRTARYIYGCSTGASSYFSAALGKAAKIDHLAKIDAAALIARGTAHPPPQIQGCVDTRGIAEVRRSTDPDDPVKLFRLPAGWYAQEPRFVPRAGARAEDDGWLLTYVFDESQLDADGECPSEEDDGNDDYDDSKKKKTAAAARSELWVIDARNMTDVVARIKLPQRVPYGLHGRWYSEDEIRGQRPHLGVRRERAAAEIDTSSPLAIVRDTLERWIG
ncbi:retinal pigment epithelial membrane protein [Apiospora phragmitis]|uniref:Retinal pigment epithelial membrane protein n=1 Tax=Apiospora phragmitis TaxID=2905665 RepID=A0ABR1V090_9PEZI